jgi:phosphoserine phosphatase
MDIMKTQAFSCLRHSYGVDSIDNMADYKTRIILIRHGESEWNISHLYTGQSDVALSGLGRAQAQCVAAYLADKGVTAIYSSPLLRARETAAPLAALTHLPIRIEPGLIEINHGLWQGLTVAQVREKFPGQYERWRAQPHRVTMPQGESLTNVAARAAPALQRICQAERRGTIAVFSHDATLRVVISLAQGEPLERFWDWNMENASLNWIEAPVNGETFRLLRLNETEHLVGLRADPALQAL